MSLRELERSSIRDFVASAAEAGYLSGRVLDYGCGRQPYRLIVEANGGEYVGYDHTSFPANVSGRDVGEWPWYQQDYDSILCTQVVQYVPMYREPGMAAPHTLGDLLNKFHIHADTLVLTYPTHWPEVEPEDMWRFTKAGMEHLLTEAGFEILRHERRSELVNRDGTWALGYGVVARA